MRNCQHTFSEQKSVLHGTRGSKRHRAVADRRELGSNRLETQLGCVSQTSGTMKEVSSPFSGGARRALCHAPDKMDCGGLRGYTPGTLIMATWIWAPNRMTTATCRPNRCQRHRLLYSTKPCSVNWPERSHRDVANSPVGWNWNTVGPRWSLGGPSWSWCSFNYYIYIYTHTVSSHIVTMIPRILRFRLTLYNLEKRRTLTSQNLVLDQTAPSLHRHRRSAHVSCTTSNPSTYRARRAGRLAS